MYDVTNSIALPHGRQDLPPLQTYEYSLCVELMIGK